jgi:hypothetical protein
MPEPAVLDFESPAIIDGEYRYTLTRTWDASLPPMVFVMLNPSTADATQDDPTITRIRRRALRDAYLGRRTVWFGRLIVVNLFALRSTDPNGLRYHLHPEGPDNDAYILSAGQVPGAVVVAAWGGFSYAYERAREVTALLTGAGVSLWCLGRTKYGQPRHPLYVRSDAPLVPYEVTS